jgi:hypothetical protein
VYSVSSDRQIHSPAGPIGRRILRWRALVPVSHGTLATGRTDSTGAAARNQTLSEPRAAAVEEYLVSKGVAVDRLTTVGFGASQPVADNGTELGRAQNRRVELVRK